MADEERVCHAVPGFEGVPTFNWVLTRTHHADIVKLVIRPYILPVIFVPGIMGSNLRKKKNKAPVWRLDGTFGQPLGLVADMASMSAGTRQQELNPGTVEVDERGSVPKFISSVGDQAAILKRGWGQVGETSYGGFLLWLEQHLNQMPANPAKWSDYAQAGTKLAAPASTGVEEKLSPGVKVSIAGEPFGAECSPFEALKTDDILARAHFYMPVHAFGYNWLASCEEAGLALAKYIDKLIAKYDQGPFWCGQVLLVTHSMGGLVARSCIAQPGVAAKVAGVVHGVIPAIGAAAAYRRCKVGMADEDSLAGLVIGNSGPAVTAVFAQAPGALQLLPSKDYPMSWLRIHGPHQEIKAWPQSDPYAEIYLERDKWWGLVKEAWLSPKDGSPIRWEKFAFNVKLAARFHESITGKYHPQTYAFYGKDKERASFEKVTWRMQEGIAPDTKPRPNFDAVAAMEHGQVRQDGSATAYVGGGPQIAPFEETAPYQASYWELHCELQDCAGDGTVPAVSGASPREKGGGNIKQQFALKGFSHDAAYKDENARRAALYAITRIAARAKTP
jgi:pimeloyl-ACP methyl ester carboxylesterase